MDHFKSYLSFQRLIKINPAQTLALGFLVLIFIGTMLLMLPGATKDRNYLSFIDALFEATSAVCVTGLVVVDTQSTFTLFGQIVLMLLIQIGGLGFMTFGILIALFLGKNIGLKGRMMIQESLNQISLEGMVKLVKFVVGFTFLIEATGAVILSIRWAPDFGFPNSIYYGIFHSVSAFNNAGFDIMGNFNSVTSYVGDATVILTLSSLLIVGGIGYTVILDLIKKKSLRKLALHTKIVLLITFILNITATIFILFLEYNNPGTLGELPLKEKILGAYFHAVVPRTAGFNSLNTADMTLSSQFLTMLLMFIGGGSGGTAGGIKVTTFAVIILAVGTIIRGRDDVEVMGRRIPKELIFRAFSITIYSAFIVLLILFILTITEKGVPLNVLLFEVISAFGTVGMSLGLTPDLSPTGKVLISLMMFIGRVGPLTLAFALAKANKKQAVKHAEERIMIG
ncbi:MULTISPECIES: TrkH family potassium uptake protein [Mesobacillus]|uniref:Ktr system potassium transporter B n=2 Tax=Mesobacillus TaxID=2675231 RepID=A0A0D6Z5E4_9BACI|nr:MULTISPECIES: TrkH family potassium uptake protein [Mesobacillus]KIY20964.1 Ktr system potassium transporter B [Mesobacillus subterraneus]MDQ0413441.1 trk system potassium uptake protein TrkH [Mesobacillus stamsii]